MKTSLLIIYVQLLAYGAVISPACTPNSPHQPTNQEKIMISTPILTGDTITISALSGHSIGHGQFHIENPGADNMEVQILRADLIIGDSQQTLSPLYLMLENEEKSIPAENFMVEQSGGSDFMISFPAVEVNPYSNLQHAIQLTIKVDDRELSAVSTIVLERRIPR